MTFANWPSPCLLRQSASIPHRSYQCTNPSSLYTVKLALNTAMLSKGEHHGGKRDPRVQKGTLSQHHGRRSSAFNAAIVARSFEQAEANGNANWWRADLMNHSESYRPMRKGFNEMETDSTNQVPMDGDADPMVSSDETIPLGTIQLKNLTHLSGP